MQRQENEVPTYACTSREGLLDDVKKSAIANMLGKIHIEEAGGARYFAQVVFQEIASGSHFIAGQPAPDGQMWIRADIRSGRTATQKSAILNRICAEISAIVGTSPENVWVYITDVPADGIAEYGRVLPQPGEEQAWLDSLPDDLRDRLVRL